MRLEPQGVVLDGEATTDRPPPRGHPVRPDGPNTLHALTLLISPVALDEKRRVGEP